jgi:hypothetical protein
MASVHRHHGHDGVVFPFGATRRLQKEEGIFWNGFPVVNRH